MTLKHLIGVLCAAFSLTAVAAETTIQAVTFTHPDGRAAPADIYIDGEITPTLPRQFATALSQSGIQRGTVYLNSVGGDLQAGIELGDFLRGKGFNTAVGRRGPDNSKPLPASCQSACLMSYAGGVYRFADPKSFLGIHRFFSKSVGTQDLALGQVVSAKITGYLGRMGVSPELFQRMANAGPTMQKLSVAEAASLNLVNNGSLPAKWEILGQAGRVFLQGQQQTWNGHGKIQLSCSKGEGLSFTALYDAELNTGTIYRSTKHLAIRLDGRFIGIESSLVQRTGIIESGFLTTQFKLPQNLAQELGRARTIGFAWIPAEASVFYGFDLPVSQSGDTIRSFVAHCSAF